MSDARFSELIAGYTFLEGPRWHDGRLWLSDFYTQQVLAVDSNGRAETMAHVPQQPSGLGWLPDGRLLMVSMRDRRILHRERDGLVLQHADLSDVTGGHANDMVVDTQGRAYVGNFGFDLMGGGTPAKTSLVRVDPDGSVTVVARDLYFPNGAMLSPDGKTLMVCETMGNRISSFEVQPNGRLGPRRDWAAWAPPPAMRDVPSVMAGLKMAPDGAALDAEGAIWFADAVGNRAIRMAPGGTILEEISTGNMGCFALTLGGPDRRTLFLCVAPDFHEQARMASRAAAIWTTQVRVSGAGHP